MGTFIIRRVLWMLLVLFGVSVITFALMHVIPGGPFSAEKKLPPEIINNLNQKYGLDKPLIEQYTSYVGSILIPQITSGDLNPEQLSNYIFNIPLVGGYTFQWMNFGPSYKSRSTTVNDIFRKQLPVSAVLGVVSTIVALVIGIPMGVLAGLNRNTPADYTSMGIAILGVSVPVIVLGPVMIWLFGISLGWLPVSGWGTPAHLIMPSFALGFGSSAIIARLTRASLLEVLHEDYIRTARAKGLHERVVIIVHGMKNAMIPVVTVIGPLFAGLVTGTFVAEQIFGIPGMGRYFVDSITNRDYSVIMGTVLLYSTLLVVSNLIVDIMYGWLDPRIRYN